MSTPEALRVAALLEKIDGQHWQVQDSAAELLRRQHAEVERLTAAHHAAVEMSNVMHGRWLAAEAERDALRKYAKRYDFLHNDFIPMGLNIDGNHAWAYRRNCTLRGPTLDAAIDAAMAGDKP